MSLADKLEGKTAQPNQPNRPNRPHQPRQEGHGGEMALALTGAIQQQATALATAAQAANISIDHAAEQISDYMATVLGGEALLAATLTKTQEKLQQRGGGIQIEHGVQTIDINLPLPSYGDVRQGFVAMFNGAKAETQNPYTAALEAARKQQDEALNNA